MPLQWSFKFPFQLTTRQNCFACRKKTSFRMLLLCLTDHAVWGAGWWRQPPADPANPGRATDCGSTVRPERIHPASPGGPSAVRRRPTDPHTTAAFRGRRRGGLSASPTGHTDSRRTNPNLSAHSGKVLCKVFLQNSCWNSWAPVTASPW